MSRFCKRGHDTLVTGRYKDSSCKACEQLPERKEYYKRYQSSLRGREVQRKFDSSPKGRISDRKFHLRGTYDLTVSEYEKLYEIQEGKCAICSRPQSEFKKRLSVDHNHKTGKVRGLLCNKCNLQLVVIEDTEFTRKAKRYLQRKGIKNE